MSCNTNCCPEPGKIVDEYCQVFNTTGNQLLWADGLPEQHNTTVTISLDEVSASNAAVTISLVGGTNIIYTLLPGQSRTDTISTVSGVTVGPTTVNTVIKGKSCIKTIYLIYK